METMPELLVNYVQKAVTLLFTGRVDRRRNSRDEAENKLNEATMS